MSITDSMFDLLADSSEGLTITDMAYEVGTTKPTIRDAVITLRRILSSGDINLICEKQGKGEWLYRLVGRYSEYAEWGLWHRKGTRGRVLTEIAVLTSMLNEAEDGWEKSLATRELRTWEYLLTMIDE